MKLKYGHSTIQVQFDKRFSEDNDLGNQHGYKIRVAVDQDETEQVVTLLHEIFHCFCRRNSLGLSEELEERVVDVLSDNLTEVLVRNPKLFKWIEERI